MRLQEEERRRQQSKRGRAAEQDRRDQHLHDEAVLRPRVAAGRVKPCDGVGVGHNRGPPLDSASGLEDHRILSFAKWCRLCGFSLATGRRIINAGNGPIITQLSPRRIGITLANHVRWQESRARGVA